MATYLVCPTEQVGWRVPVDALDEFLRSRWPEVQRRTGDSDQRTHLWEFPDRNELWVPDDREVAWLEGDATRAAAVAVHLAVSGPQNLILTDGEYSFDLEVEGKNETEVLNALRAIDQQSE